MGTEFIAVGFIILFTIATSGLLGLYMSKVFTVQAHLPRSAPRPDRTARAARDAASIPNEQQDWKRYSVSLLVSNIFMWLATFAVVTTAEMAAAQP